jgi:flagellar biogenesis protein FliO
METTSTPLILVAPVKPARGAFSRALAVARTRFEVFRRALVSRARRRQRSLVVIESSPLGDRRFVTVLQFERQRFLIGSSPSSVTLLARLPNAGPGAGNGHVPGCDGGNQ